MFEIEEKTIKKLIDNNWLEIKTSFEDEGADFIEVMFLKTFCDVNNLSLTLKVGGCEAIRDFKDANKLQIKKIVAPMIESAFGLEKFIKSSEKFYTVKNSKISINVESKQCVQNIEEILSSSMISKLSNITIGRGDLVQSYGMDRYTGSVDSKKIYEIAKNVFTLARQKKLGCTLGGSMSANSKEFVSSLVNEHILDKFETRNVIVNVEALKVIEFDEIIKAALNFELRYLNFKKNYYNTLYTQDELRIKKLSV